MTDTATRSWSPEWQRHRALLDEAVDKNPTYPGGYSGRGIVIAGGGATYFACAMVGYQVLRQLGCRLPVQLWHLGASELDPTMRGVAEDAGIECVDALRVARGLREGERPRRLNGWELKSFAVQHCPYREVLYLDADNVPARDPTFLFDDMEYRSKGAIFWPDLPPPGRGEWIPTRVKELVGLSRLDRSGDDPALESGQLLIDKERCWPELMLVRHLSDYSDFWYERVYGDKDTFWLAWHRLGKDYVKPKSPRWLRPAIQQYAPESSGGGLLFQHACQAKVQLARAQRVPSLLYGDVVQDIGVALRRRWHGQIWSAKDESPREKELVKSVLGKYRYVRLDGLGERRLQLLPDGRIGEGVSDSERRWTLRVLPHDLPLYPYHLPNNIPKNSLTNTPTQVPNNLPPDSTTYPPFSQEKVWVTGVPVTMVVLVGGGSKRNEIGLVFLSQREDSGVPLISKGGTRDWHGYWQAHERSEVVLERID